MAMNARIRELGNRHRSLDAAIEDEMSRPAVDSIRLWELKRRKLRLKEEMESLKVELLTDVAPSAGLTPRTGLRPRPVPYASSAGAASSASES